MRLRHAIVTAMSLWCVTRWGGVANAHGGPGGARTHRLVVVEVHAERLEVAFSTLLSPLASREAREEADLDHDGRLDAREKASLAAAVRGRALASLVLSVDGENMAPRLSDARATLDDDAAKDALASVSFHATVPLAPGPHRLVVSDDGSAIGGDLNARVDARGAARLAGRDSRTVLFHRHDGHAHAGEHAEDGPLTIDVVGRDPATIPRPVAYAALGLGVLLAGAALRRRHRASAAPVPTPEGPRVEG